MVPHTLYGIGMIPACMYGPPHVKCLHVLYDSYGPPIHYMEKVSYGPPHVHVVSPLSYMEQVSYGSPTCMIQVLYGPPTC